MELDQIHQHTGNAASRAKPLQSLLQSLLQDATFRDRTPLSSMQKKFIEKSLHPAIIQLFHQKKFVNVCLLNSWIQTFFYEFSMDFVQWTYFCEFFLLIFFIEFFYGFFHEFCTLSMWLLCWITIKHYCNVHFIKLILYIFCALTICMLDKGVLPWQIASCNKLCRESLLEVEWNPCAGESIPIPLRLWGCRYLSLCAPGVHVIRALGCVFFAFICDIPL